MGWEGVQLTEKKKGWVLVASGGKVRSDAESVMGKGGPPETQVFFTGRPKEEKGK